MAVGTLSIATVSPTGEARGEIGKLRTEIKGLRADVAGTSMVLDKLEMPEIGRTFYFPKEEMRGTLTETEKFRTATVNLTGDTGRYSAEAMKQTGVLRGLKGGLGQLKTGLAGLAAAPAVFSIGVNFGQKIREYVSEVHSMADAWHQVKAVLGLVVPLQDQYFEKMANRQKILDAESAAAKARSEKERQTYKDFEKRLRLEQAGVLKAKGFNVDTQLEDDVEQFGQANANKLYALRQQAIDEERHAEEEKLRKEKEIDALKERQHKWEQAQAKALEKRKKEEQTIVDLRRQVADYWKSDREKEESKTLGGISDPARRREAEFRFAQLKAADAVKKEQENLKRDRDVLRGRKQPGFLDARTGEGWAALRGGGSQEKLLKSNERQAAALDRIVAAVERRGGGGDQPFDPFEEL